MSSQTPPEEWESRTFRYRCPEGKCFIILGGADRPEYVCILLGKAGSSEAALCQGLAEMVMRAPDPHEVWLALVGISSEKTNKLTHEAWSIPDAVARALKEVYDPEDKWKKL